MKLKDPFPILAKGGLGTAVVTKLDILKSELENKKRIKP
jgi:hypothetical protein